MVWGFKLLALAVVDRRAAARFPAFLFSVLVGGNSLRTRGICACYYYRPNPSASRCIVGWDVFILSVIYI